MFKIVLLTVFAFLPNTFAGTGDIGSGGVLSKKCPVVESAKTYHCKSTNTPFLTAWTKKVQIVVPDSTLCVDIYSQVAIVKFDYEYKFADSNTYGNYGYQLRLPYYVVRDTKLTDEAGLYTSRADRYFSERDTEVRFEMDLADLKATLVEEVKRARYEYLCTEQK